MTLALALVTLVAAQAAGPVEAAVGAPAGAPPPDAPPPASALDASVSASARLGARLSPGSNAHQIVAPAAGLALGVAVTPWFVPALRYDFAWHQEGPGVVSQRRVTQDLTALALGRLRFGRYVALDLGPGFAVTALATTTFVDTSRGTWRFDPRLAGHAALLVALPDTRWFASFETTVLWGTPGLDRFHAAGFGLRL